METWSNCVNVLMFCSGNNIDDKNENKKHLRKKLYLDQLAGHLFKMYTKRHFKRKLRSYLYVKTSFNVQQHQIKILNFKMKLNIQVN